MVTLIHFNCIQIDDYSLVKFVPLDITDEEMIGAVLYEVDNSIQYGEDLEPREMPVSVIIEVKLFADYSSWTQAHQFNIALSLETRERNLEPPSDGMQQCIREYCSLS